MLSQAKIKNILKETLKEGRYYYILAFIFLLIQSSIIIKYLSISNISPDLLLVLFIYFSIKNGYYQSLKFGIFIGFLKDMLNPTYIVLDTLIFIILSGVIWIIKRQIEIKNIFLKLVVLILVLLIYVLIKTVVVYRELYLDIIAIFIFIALNITTLIIYNIIFEEGTKEEWS